MRRRNARRVGENGRAALPRALREAIQISFGDVFELSVGERDEVLVRTAHGQEGDGAVTHPGLGALLTQPVAAWVARVPAAAQTVAVRRAT